MEEQFQLLFEKMKLEMEVQSNTIMAKIDEKLVPLVEENRNLRTKVEKFEKELEYLKRGQRENNIIIFGLEETETCTLDLIQNLNEHFKQDLKINLKSFELNKIHRIGHKKPGDNKPRPIVCSFINNWKKCEIIKKKKNLKKIYITEDYSKEVLQKRKQLQSDLMEERNKGNFAYLKCDRLIVKQNTNHQEKRKRDSSVSPNAGNIQPKKQQSRFPTMSKRADAFDIMRARSNSLTNLAPKNNQ